MASFAENISCRRGSSGVAGPDDVDSALRELDDDYLADDIAMYSVVAAISTLDDFMQNIYLTVVLGYLNGNYSPKRKMSAKIPATSARCLIEAAKLGKDLGVGEHANLVFSDLTRSYGRKNFQGAEHFDQALTELGLPKYKDISNSGSAKNFKSVVGILARRRHEYVHRMGSVRRGISLDGSGCIHTPPVTDEQLAVLGEFVEEIGKFTKGVLT